jgi:hypothetical protein
MNRVTFAIRASGALLLAMLLLIGPGAGGEGGISGSGFLRGSIQRFGSIFVNDVHLTVAKADVSVDGVAADASDLRVGQQVIVTVDAPDPDDSSHDPLLPEAAEVRYFSHVVAPVQAFNASSGTITALDQTIITFTGTYVDGLDLDELTRNTWIRVSGQRSGASSLLATYIGPAEPGTVMLRGAVGEATRRFDLLVAGVPVEASALYGADDLEPGNEVWVSGYLLPRGTLIAERIEPLQVELADHVSLQGILEAVGDGFALDGLAIQLLEDDETEFENGEADDLVAGARVEVEGQLVDGALAASKILFSPLRTVEAEGNIQLIDQVDPGNQTAW